MASSPIPSTSPNREPFIPNRSTIFSGHHPFKLLQAVMKAGSAKLLPWLPSTLLSPTLSLSSLARTHPLCKPRVLKLDQYELNPVVCEQVPFGISSMEGVPEETKVAVIDVTMDVLGAESYRVYSVIESAQCSRTV
ncbi:uncharacterized protein G2W53_039362 [Senna tora]|uniref:Uncharacterized protein n=1 Tax=Senna tora TaxID=362788 RepID=A0A834W620_9FABA|nr:uncharacterized protein G2W53_039362 [Senna tora]